MSAADLRVEPITKPDAYDEHHGYTHQLSGAYPSGNRWRECFRSKAAATRALNKKIEIERHEAERRRPGPKSASELQAQVDDFNARYPVGQRVTLRNDRGEGVTTVTRAAAEVLSGHSAVIWLDGISGCYLLDRITPMTGDAA